jgi:AcrR family transcriptional regulator
MARRLSLALQTRKTRAPRPNKHRGNQRSEEILGVALALFAEHGYTGVSIQDIARSGKINAALIYYYFHNKDHLFVEAIKYSVSSALMRHQQFDGGHADPVAGINCWFETNTKLAKPLGQMFRLMLDYRASRKPSSSIERLIKEFYETEIGILREAIGVGVKRGIFRPQDASKMALFISTHLDGLTAAAAIRPDYDVAAGLRQMRKIVFGYLGHTKLARSRNGRARLSRLRVAA